MKLPWRKKQPVRALIGESGPEVTVKINVSGGDPQAVVDAIRAYMRRARGPWPPPKLGDVYYRGNHTDVIRGRYTEGFTHRTTPRGSCEANTGSGTNSAKESQ